MSRFTKEIRQKIVEDFSRRHNGQYNPALFLEEVKSKGSEHPAYDWFEWDSQKAAGEYHLWQARSFAKDLRISFTVEEIGRNSAVTVRTTTMPMVLSAVDGRKDGGGYVIANPDDPEHMAEHCRQAASALRSWLKRYEACLGYAGSSVRVIEQISDLLENVPSSKADAAE